MRRAQNQMQVMRARRQSLYHLFVSVPAAQLMLERRLEKAGNDPLNTPRVLERLNSLVLYRHETDDKPKLYWQEIPKEDRLLMERLGIKIPAPISVI